jgi:glyoxylase-like metal-dependent hydrolase (beta-lactamase superfamily II)
MASNPVGTGSVDILVGTAGYPRLLRWTMSWPREDGGVRKWHSYALTTSDGPVLIDPVMPDGKTMSQLEAHIEQMGGYPAASILTNDMHERSAYVARTQYSVPVWAPKAGEGEYEGKPDRLFGSEDRLPGGIAALPVRAAFVGDTLLAWTMTDGKVVIFSGDVIMERSNHLAFHGPSAHPKSAGSNAEIAESVNAALAPYRDRIAMVLSAHGGPFTGDLGSALASLLDGEH